MSTHRTSARWSRTSPDFAYDTFPRDHVVTLTGNEVLASSTPEYKGSAERTNPEELLVSALSTCHMLTFLAICSKKSLVVDSYEDEAEGHLEKGPDGRLWVTRIVLHPKAVFAEGTVVDAPTLSRLHESAHRGCFIAGSIKAEVTVEPR